MKYANRTFANAKIWKCPFIELMHKLSSIKYNQFLFYLTF